MNSGVQLQPWQEVSATASHSLPLHSKYRRTTQLHLLAFARIRTPLIGGSVAHPPESSDSLCAAGVIAKAAGLQPRGRVVAIAHRRARGAYCGGLQPFSPLVPGRDGHQQLCASDR